MGIGPETLVTMLLDLTAFTLPVFIFSTTFNIFSMSKQREAVIESNC